tara:strand:- start:15 stop:209 length:195 start_codon:yes stop_codon:yes gene_type:complete
MAFPTNPIYKFIKDRETNTNISIYKRRNEGGNWVDTVIPIEETNTDYQEYLKWVEEGNTADAAD